MKLIKDLQREIRAVLLRDWDPIGVGDVPAAADEYDTQVIAIAGMIHSRKITHEILWQYLDDEGHELMPTWDDAEGLAAATKEIMGIAGRNHLPSP